MPTVGIAAHFQRLLDLPETTAEDVLRVAGIYPAGTALAERWLVEHASAGDLPQIARWLMQRRSGDSVSAEFLRWLEIAATSPDDIVAAVCALRGRHSALITKYLDLPVDPEQLRDLMLSGCFGPSMEQWPMDDYCRAIDLVCTGLVDDPTLVHNFVDVSPVFVERIADRVMNAVLCASRVAPQTWAFLLTHPDIGRYALVSLGAATMTADDASELESLLPSGHPGIPCLRIAGNQTPTE